MCSSVNTQSIKIEILNTSDQWAVRQNLRILTGEKQITKRCVKLVIVGSWNIAHFGIVIFPHVFSLHTSQKVVVVIGEVTSKNSIVITQVRTKRFEVHQFTIPEIIRRKIVVFQS